MSNHRHIPRLTAIIIAIIVCSNILLETNAQSYDADQCRRQCTSILQQIFGNNLNSAIYMNYLNNCYRSCPQGGNNYRTTLSPNIRTTTSSNYRTQNCGQSGYRGRVIGGPMTGECEFPWVVAVTVNSLFCGGSIIDRRHILTAAHCLRDRYTQAVAPASQVQVRVGSSQLTQLRVYRVQQVIVDSRHVPNINDYDVAILRLYEDLTFNNCVSPICLPQVWEDPRKAEYCVAAGWGIANLQSQRLEANLRKVVLPIVDNAQCVQSYGTNYVNNLKICAGDFSDGGIDTCQGDSGGPLMCLFGDRFVAMGIVSFGSGCARPRYPGVYTRVAHEAILTFIRQTTRGF